MYVVGITEAAHKHNHLDYRMIEGQKVAELEEMLVNTAPPLVVPQEPTNRRRLVVVANCNLRITQHPEPLFFARRLAPWARVGAETSSNVAVCYTSVLPEVVFPQQPGSPGLSRVLMDYPNNGLLYLRPIDPRAIVDIPEGTPIAFVSLLFDLVQIEE